MRQSLAAVLMSAFFVFAGTFAPGAAEEITVEGVIVDTKCYGMATGMDMPEAAIGNDHMVPGADGKMMEVPGCGTACAMMGIPTGIVEGGEPGGKTYVIITSATALKDHVAKRARVTGETAFGGGIIASKVEVFEDGSWVDVTPASMM